MPEATRFTGMGGVISFEQIQNCTISAPFLDHFCTISAPSAVFERCSFWATSLDTKAQRVPLRRREHLHGAKTKQKQCKNRPRAPTHGHDVSESTRAETVARTCKNLPFLTEFSTFPSSTLFGDAPGKSPWCWHRSVISLFTHAPRISRAT